MKPGVSYLGQVFVLLIVAVTSSCALGMVAEENVCPIEELPKVSWVRHDWGFTVRDGVVRLEGRKDRPVSYGLENLWFPRFVAAKDLVVTLEFRGTVGAACVKLNGRPMERCGLSRMQYQERPFYPKEKEWRKASLRVAFPQTDAWNYGLCIYIERGREGFLEFRNLHIAEVPPDDARTGRPLLIGGAEATEVAILATDDVRRHGQELLAARQFRYTLRASGGRYLPIRTAKDLAEIAPAAVLVGAAAERASLVPAAEMAKVNRGLTGGGVYRACGTRLGLSGAIPSGMSFAVFKFFCDIGVEFLGEGCWRTPPGETFAVADGWTVTHIPAIAQTMLVNGTRIGQMREMRGYMGQSPTVAPFTVGARSEVVEADHSLPLSLVTLDEFADSHPEFFALQSDGKRQGRGTSPYVLQYCYSQPALAELVGHRMVEMMRACPHSTCFMISPGDGRNRYCRCSECAKHNQADNWLMFANKVAAITSKEFPDRYLTIYSYVDTPEPPDMGVRPHPNVLCDYCIYISSHWPSGMIYRHPLNARGHKALAGWRETFSRLGLTYYPQQCGEWFYLWPGYKCDVDAVRDFAKHGAYQVRYFGLFPTHGVHMPQSGAFTDLRIYILERIRENPSFDERPAARAFIRDFYGKAAPKMQEYFDYIVEEPERRDWVQYCEQHSKGFTTKKCAAKCLPLLDTAEAAAATPAERERVLHEKLLFLWTYLSDVCRGRGNVSSAEFHAWSKRVVEFIRICKETQVWHMGRGVKPSNWFNELAFVKLSNDDCWPKDPVVEAILKDPEKELGGNVPNCAERTADGFLIPACGMSGGSFAKGTKMRSAEPFDFRCLRRPTSGFGLAFTTLDLTQTPSGEAVLHVMGTDCEKPGVTSVRFSVNGKAVYEGPAPFPKDRWSELAVKLPAGTLVRGRNDIQLENLTADTESAQDGEGGDYFRAPRDYYWGWYCVRSVRFSGVK